MENLQNAQTSLQQERICELRAGKKSEKFGVWLKLTRKAEVCLKSAVAVASTIDSSSKQGYPNLIASTFKLISDTS
jgi:hypothetical protein